LGDRFFMAEDLYLKGVVQIRLGFTSEGIALSRESALISEESGALDLVSEANWIMSIGHLCEGDLEQADRAIERALECHQKYLLEWTKMLRGVIAFRLGQIERAEEAFIECIEAAAKKLEGDPQNFDPLDSTALSYSGLSLCRHPNAKRHAMDSFSKARAITSATGIVDMVLLVFDALDTEHLLSEIRRINRREPQL
jgi:tetratricopeptide (TPR) repeat protein